MRNIKIIRFISLIMTVLPTILTLISFKYMPETVPTHYGVDGMVDGYGSKYSLLTLPVICIIMSVIMMAVAYFYRKEKAEAGKISNSEAIYFINIAMLAVFSIMTGNMIYTSMKGITDLNTLAVPFDSIMFGLIGVLYIAIGVVISKLGKNSNSFGNSIQYRSEKTPKRIGKTFVVIGIINIIFNVFSRNTLLSVFFFIFISLIGTFIALYYAATDKKD